MVRYAREVYKPSLTILSGYFEMLNSGWKRSDHPNMLFLWYELMKEDQKKVISEIAQHIGYQLTEAELDKVDEYTRLRFDSPNIQLSFIPGSTTLARRAA